jgi:hypothetical protein
MRLSKQDQTIMTALRKAKPLYPDLGKVLDFYENLFQVQFVFKSQLASSATVEHLGNMEIHIENLAEGLPQVTFAELQMESAPLPDLFRKVLDLLIPYTGYSDAIGPEPLPAKIVEHAREIFLGRGPLVGSGSSGDLVRTASGFVLAPFLQLARERILPRISPDRWHREFCPICGGRAAFAALTPESGSRTLLCPRCFGEWSYGRIGCPFCKSTDSQTYYSDEDSRYRLYVCGNCSHYLKTIDARDGAPDLCLPVECILTVSMDVAAQKRGFKAS